MAKTIFRRKNQRKKRLILAVIACVLAVALTIGIIAIVLNNSDGASSPDGAQTAPTATTTTRPSLPKTFIDNNTFSEYMVLYDATSDQVLYSKNADAKCYPASLTKMITALVALDYTKPEDVITVGSEINLIGYNSSTAGLNAGNKLTMKQLLQALLIQSGNDAAYVIAVHVGRIITNNPKLDRYAAVSKFCEAMNKKAKALGCSDTTHFSNPDGYHADDHHTTANDMLKAAKAVLGNDLLREIVGTPVVKAKLASGGTKTWKNSNYLLQELDKNGHKNKYYYPAAFGLKTGTTDEAGCCLAACAQRDGRTLVLIAMGAELDENRWVDVCGLFDLSFSH